MEKSMLGVRSASYCQSSLARPGGVCVVLRWVVWWCFRWRAYNRRFYSMLVGYGAMNWIVFEALCRRRHKDVDEVLVQWACAWIKQADFLAGTHGFGEEVARRQTIHGDTEVLVQWACSWIPASDCDAGLLQELIARDSLVGEHVCIGGDGDVVLAIVKAPDEKKRAPVNRRKRKKGGHGNRRKRKKGGHGW
jgi:hypothetical protein